MTLRFLLTLFHLPRNTESKEPLPNGHRFPELRVKQHHQVPGDLRMEALQLFTGVLQAAIVDVVEAIGKRVRLRYNCDLTRTRELGGRVG